MVPYFLAFIKYTGLESIVIVQMLGLKFWRKLEASFETYRRQKAWEQLLWVLVHPAHHKFLEIEVSPKLLQER